MMTIGAGDGRVSRMEIAIMPAAKTTKINLNVVDDTSGTPYESSFDRWHKKQGDQDAANKTIVDASIVGQLEGLLDQHFDARDQMRSDW